MRQPDERASRQGNGVVNNFGFLGVLGFVHKFGELPHPIDLSVKELELHFPETDPLSVDHPHNDLAAVRGVPCAPA